MIYLKALPPVVLILVMMIASLIAGAAWGFLPGFFKARWNTNETLFTLMMNYIAIQLTSFFVAKWEYPFGSNHRRHHQPHRQAGLAAEHVL